MVGSGTWEARRSLWPCFSTTNAFMCALTSSRWFSVAECASVHCAGASGRGCRRRRASRQGFGQMEEIDALPRDRGRAHLPEPGEVGAQEGREASGRHHALRLADEEVAAHRQPIALAAEPAAAKGNRFDAVDRGVRAAVVAEVDSA